ncbi:iron(III) transport system ATP-binding protein [Herbaspirillum sp. Sphag1AN]|uniref:putative 2-aminoethylphosphonate ABC transporter ATP-binding protein n=1 Tax=unclassified Herbaspirillum TaxID=2624150 RepID=UPI001621CF92|nr:MULTISPECIES: putative 2-aminoethylphosphonate ABC transporter ATP-binding protein [unclassified Herbaspirillum]MBB3212146.1 iron(III) transport system ATP-binding protein [Herbaspirillum sp. Sphag1AN]MBB3244020.1 iron(III) transport system ATP-binding protein [Herbaspirillum sp. Sphag64]
MSNPLSTPADSRFQPEDEAFLSIRHVAKRFDAFTALDQVSLDVKQGEMVCLLGPSGCGKTTLLRVIAGLERHDQGSIFAHGDDISLLPPQARDYGILFQSYALFPNLTVAQNVAYGLSAKRLSRSQQQQRVQEMLEMIGLPDSGKKYPGQLSGGQQQRVALARALAPSPSLLLLDEPLSALDAQVREHLQLEIRRLQKQFHITTLMVTHDQEEAMVMADRIAIMQHGRIEQFDTPDRIYRQPATPFVADFVGQANWLPYDRVDAAHIRIGALQLEVAHSVQQGSADTSSGRLFCRPEAVDLFPAADACNRFSARVVDQIYLGDRYRMLLELEQLPGQRLMADITNAVRSQLPDIASDALWISLPQRSLQLFS